MMRRFLHVVCLLVGPSAGLAQEGLLRGRLLLPDSSAARGVLVEAVHTTDGAYRSRTVSGSDGSFQLRIPFGGRWRARALRVGYVPSALGEFDVALQQVVELPAPIVLLSGTLTLASLAVDSADVCGHADDAGLLVSTLLGQARVALASTLHGTPEPGTTSEWRRFEIFTDRAGTPLSPLRVVEGRSATDRPFGAVSSRALAAEGYRWELADLVQFNAPDAEVLLSEEFVTGHCFWLGPPHPEHGEWIGVAFTPTERAGRRGRTDVRGTLWLDRETAELRRVAFDYVGLPATIAAVGARGVTDFHRLPSDVWIVSGWELRVPRPEVLAVVEQGQRVQREGTSNAVAIKGGEVAVIRRGTEELYRSWTQPADRLGDVAARASERPMCADPVGANPQDRGMIYGTITDSTGRPVRAAVHAQFAFGRSRRPLLTRESRDVSADDGFYIFCGLPLGQRIDILATTDSERLTATVPARLDGSNPSLSLPLSVLPDAKVVMPAIWSGSLIP